MNPFSLFTGKRHRPAHAVDKSIEAETFDAARQEWNAALAALHPLLARNPRSSALRAAVLRLLLARDAVASALDPAPSARRDQLPTVAAIDRELERLAPAVVKFTRRDDFNVWRDAGQGASPNAWWWNLDTRAADLTPRTTKLLVLGLSVLAWGCVTLSLSLISQLAGKILSAKPDAFVGVITFSQAVLTAAVAGKLLRTSSTRPRDAALKLAPAVLVFALVFVINTQVGEISEYYVAKGRGLRDLQVQTSDAPPAPTSAPAADDPLQPAPSPTPDRRFQASKPAAPSPSLVVMALARGDQALQQFTRRSPNGGAGSAIEAFQLAASLNPDSADAEYELGYAFGEVHDLDAALAHYRTAIRLNPSYLDPLFNYADLAIRRGDFAKAIELLGNTSSENLPLSDSPDNNNAYLYWRFHGSANLGLRHFAVAEQDLTRALSFRAQQGDGTGAHCLLAQVLEARAATAVPFPPRADQVPLQARERALEHWRQCLRFEHEGRRVQGVNSATDLPYWEGILPTWMEMAKERIMTWQTAD